jgi:hypothetical protein
MPIQAFSFHDRSAIRQIGTVDKTDLMTWFAKTNFNGGVWRGHPLMHSGLIR